MKRPVFISICVMAVFLFALPLWAEEQLMTKLFFENWLKRATAPLEEQIERLRADYAALEQGARQLKSQVYTEIKVIIGQTTAYIDGQAVTLDVPPAVIAGRTMVPVKFIGETFGARFSWDEKLRRVTYDLEGLIIELFIGQTTVKVNGRNEPIDIAPVIVNGRTMVPVRFIGSHLGASFEWDGQRQMVTIFR